MNIHEDLKAYLDGELDPRRAAEVRAAIEADPELQAEIDMLKKIGSSLSAHSGGSVTGKEAVLAGLKQKTARRPWWTLPSYQLAAVAGCVLVVATIFPVFTQAKQSGQRMESYAATRNLATSSEKALEKDAGVEAEAPAGSTAELKSYHAQGLIGKGEERSQAADMPVIDRDIIRNSTMTLESESVTKCLDQASALVTSLGGYMESKNFSRTEDGGGTATAVAKVPTDQYSTAFSKLHDLGKVLSESESSDDVTKKTTALRAQSSYLNKKLANLQRQYRNASRRERADILWRIEEVKDELGGTKTNLKNITNAAAMSTIVLTIEEVKKVGLRDGSDNWSGNVVNSAMNNFKIAAQLLGAVCINVLAFAPFWLPVALFIWWRGRRPSASA